MRSRRTRPVVVVLAIAATGVALYGLFWVGLLTWVFFPASLLVLAGVALVVVPGVVLVRRSAAHDALAEPER